MATTILPEGVSATTLLEDSTERFNRFGAELGVGSFGINQILLKPGNRNAIHRHQRQEEVYIVSSGVLTLGVSGEELDFAVGSVIRVAAEVRRQLSNRGPEIVSLIAVGGLSDHTHAGRDGERFADWTAAEPLPREQRSVPDDYPAGELRS